MDEDDINELKASGLKVVVLDTVEDVEKFFKSLDEPQLMTRKDAELLVEAWNFGQFAADFNQPLALPIRAAIRRVCASFREQLNAER